MISWGRFYWPACMLAVTVAVGVPELIALVTNRANTLSDYSWDELHVGSFPVHTPTLAWWASLVVWLVFVVVITAHIWWRWT